MYVIIILIIIAIIIFYSIKLNKITKIEKFEFDDRNYKKELQYMTKILGPPNKIHKNQKIWNQRGCMKKISLLPSGEVEIDYYMSDILFNLDYIREPYKNKLEFISKMKECKLLPYPCLEIKIGDKSTQYQPFTYNLRIRERTMMRNFILWQIIVKYILKSRKVIKADTLYDYFEMEVRSHKYLQLGGAAAHFDYTMALKDCLLAKSVDKHKKFGLHRRFAAYRPDEI